MVGAGRDCFGTVDITAASQASSLTITPRNRTETVAKTKSWSSCPSLRPIASRTHTVHLPMLRNLRTARFPSPIPASRAFSTQSAAMAPLRIGFVPEHFSTPLEFAKKHYGFDSQLLPFPSGTGHMVTALQNNEIDVGVGLTEGWIAALGKAQAAKEDAGFRLVGTYVETPLCWAISSGTQRNNINGIEDLQGKKVGVSRIGSGSYVMSFVLADQQGWLQKGQTPFPVEVLNTFSNLRDGVNDKTADFFMWEHFTSKRYYDNGSIKRVGEIYTPWSSWKIVAANALLNPENWSHGANTTVPPLKKELEEALEKINKGIEHFEQNQEEAVQYISTKLDYSEEDAREWLKTVKFAGDVKGVDHNVVKKTVNILQKAGVLDEEVDSPAMVALGRD
jgi:ABC-type nitrate/sulfonate/bicarbonate transport system substrate-binding protein